jgi:hypothetical protein
MALECFHQTVAPAADILIETGDDIVARVKRGLQKKEYADLYLLIDIAADLSANLKEHDALIAVIHPLTLHESFTLC